MEPLIDLKNVGMVYNKGKKTAVAALDGVSLAIRREDFIGILGPSGSGKSTLLHILGALLRPTGGQYLLRGKDVYARNGTAIARLRNREFGFVLQDFGLLGERSALDNVMVPLYFSDTPNREMKGRALAALNRLSIGDLAARKTNELSGGQRQRVAIARAMVMEPAVLLADEPTGALDSKTADNIMDIFTDLNARGVAVLVVTHNQRIAGRCGKTLSIVDGKIADERQ